MRQSSLDVWRQPGPAGSLLLHLALAAALLAVPVLRRLPQTPTVVVDNVAVEIVETADVAAPRLATPSDDAVPHPAANDPGKDDGPSQAQPTGAPAPPTGPAAESAETAPAAPMVTAPSDADGYRRPSRMLSRDVLADPRSRAARAALAGVADDERLVQLCGIEAMAQIAAADPAVRPDLVIAYATADVAVTGNAVVARGAAFHAGRAWYRLAFECDVAPGHDAVSAFGFRVGAAIPRHEWEADNLPDMAGAAD